METNTKHITVTVLFCLSLCLQGFSQPNPKENDSAVFSRYVSYIQPDLSLPTNQLLIKTAKFFLNYPYVASTLEQAGDEQLVINLRELDCTTFVESCVALTLTMKSGDKSFDHFKKIVQTLRYRNGVIEGYDSRLHYSTDWIYENAAQKIWTDLTLRLGGTLEDKKLSFMSEHPQYYPALKGNSVMRDKIAKIEDIVSNRKSHALMGISTLTPSDKRIQNGDIVLFGTSIPGLDFSHMGIAYHNKGVLTFIHASATAKKVIIQPGTLKSYCKKSGKCNGIAILRLD